MPEPIIDTQFPYTADDAVHYLLYLQSGVESVRGLKHSQFKRIT